MSQSEPTRRYVSKVCIRGGEGFDAVLGEHDDGAETIRWSEVEEIIAFKQGLFSYDSICLAYRLKSGAAVVISERTAGFNEARVAMEAAFPSIPPDWFLEIAIPPFDASVTVLHPFDRDRYVALLAARRAAMEREARQRRRWPAVPLIDWCCAGAGLGVLCVRFSPASNPWGWLAFICGAGAVLCSFLLRRKYEIESFSPLTARMTSRVLRRSGVSDIAIRSISAEHARRSLWRAAPWHAAVSLVALRLTSLAALVYPVFWH